MQTIAPAIGYPVSPNTFLYLPVYRSPRLCALFLVTACLPHLSYANIRPAEKDGRGSRCYTKEVSNPVPIKVASKGIRDAPNGRNPRISCERSPLLFQQSALLFVSATKTD